MPDTGPNWEHQEGPRWDGAARWWLSGGQSRTSIALRGLRPESADSVQLLHRCVCALGPWREEECG